MKAVKFGNRWQAVNIDYLLELAEDRRTASRLMAVYADGQEMQSFLEPGGVNYLPEFPVPARRMQIVISNQWTVLGDKTLEAVLRRSRRSEVHTSVTIQIKTGIHAQ